MHKRIYKLYMHSNITNIKDFAFFIATQDLKFLTEFKIEITGELLNIAFREFYISNGHSPFEE